MKIFQRESLLLQQAFQRSLKLIGTTAVNFSKERFVRKNWLDRSSTAWQKTQKKTGSTLVASGQLKRSIRLLSLNAYKIIIGTDIPYAQIHNEGGHIEETVKVRGHYRTSFKKTRQGIGILKKNGKERTKLVKKRQGNHYVQAHTRKMNTKIPRRQFIGISAILERRIERTIDRVFVEALRK